MKRKFVVVALVLALALSITACGGISEAEAVDLYNQAQKNMQDIKDAEFKIEMEMDMESGGETMEMGASGTVQEVIHSETDVDMYMDMEMDMGSLGTHDTKAYYTDGYMYMEVMGQKIKSKSDLDSAMELSNAGATSGITLKEDMLDSVEAEKDGNNTVLEFKIKSDKVQEILGETASGDASSYLDDIESGDMTLTAVVDKDNNLKSMEIKSTLTPKGGGEGDALDYNISLEFVSFNTGLTIDFPNFDDYIEQ